MMSLFEGARTSVSVESELSEECEVIVGMHQGSELSYFCLQWRWVLSMPERVR